jgi:hypothetical protein
LLDAGGYAVVLTTEPTMTEARRLCEGLGYERTPQRDWRINGVSLITYRRDLSTASPE